MSNGIQKPLPEWLPYLVGGLLVLQFAGLCVWQLGRGLDKLERRDAFGEPESYASFRGGDVQDFAALEADGAWQAERQFLLENIVQHGRAGYYVITPLELAAGEAPLLVNRGWIPASSPTGALPQEPLEIERRSASIRGRAGALPRAGMRMGEAIRAGQDWPKTAVFPELSDLETALGTRVQPFVLLLDPDEPDGFERRWAPAEMAPGRHFAYALQWFAMGVVLAGLLAWHFRKRSLA